MRLSTAAIIVRDEKVLFVKRQSGGDLSERWELPGGKVDEGETPDAALVRELSEELGLSAAVEATAGHARFRHRNNAYELRAYYVSADTSSLELREHTDLCWCSLDEALELNLAPSDRTLIQAMVAERAR